jgi:hypothetical protein
MKRTLGVTVMAVVLLGWSPMAGAEPPTGAGSFGQHVRACAQQVGFSSEHNPGMHHGRSGWDGMACETAP